MKYQCEHCDFRWEGTSYTFEKVRDHEKMHSKKSTTLRCKVCNTKNDDHLNSNHQWECKICDNLLDSNGQVVNPQK
jgi:ribosomal protein L37AE/L43A